MYVLHKLQQDKGCHSAALNVNSYKQFKQSLLGQEHTRVLVD